MRWMALIALSLLWSGISAPAQTTPASTTTKAITSLPKPTAEPEDNGSYAKPVIPTGEGPSAADVGPVQKHFVMASETDDLATSDNEDNNHIASRLAQEKVSLDKRIKITKVHDVQDDGGARATGNAALDYETTYINWGAVTKEQLQARQGHYFTISWANHGPIDDFLARFEYREVNSKEVVRTLTQAMPRVAGTTRSYFAVVNHAYLAYGPVCSWRFTILRHGTVVAETKSFIW
jgi:hypothetical protein